MASKKKKPKLSPIQPKGRIPESIQYEGLKSMSRTDSVKDKNQRERKQTKQDLQKGNWDL